MAVQPSMNFMALATMFFFLALAIIQAAGAMKSDGGGKGDIRPSSEDLVVQACKNVSDGAIQSDKLRFAEKDCVSVLRSDSRTIEAKGHGDLVVIALDLLNRRTSEVAKDFSRVPGSNAARNQTELAFQYCVTDYGFMASTLPLCRNIFLDLKPRGKKIELGHTIRALDCMDRLGKAAMDCGVQLFKAGYAEPEFADVAMHATLAWGLMEISLNYFDDGSRW